MSGFYESATPEDMDPRHQGEWIPEPEPVEDEGDDDENERTD